MVLFSVFVGWKVAINENVKVIDHAFGIRFPVCSNSTINWKYDSEVIICQHSVIVSFFDVDVFVLSRLVAGPNFISISHYYFCCNFVYKGFD